MSGSGKIGNTEEKKPLFFDSYCTQDIVWMDYRWEMDVLADSKCFPEKHPFCIEGRWYLLPDFLNTVSSDICFLAL